LQLEQNLCLFENQFYEEVGDPEKAKKVWEISEKFVIYSKKLKIPRAKPAIIIKIKQQIICRRNQTMALYTKNA